MSKVLDKHTLAQVAYNAIPTLAFDLPADVKQALFDARARETNTRAQEVLDLLINNASIAHNDRVAICQDTGSVWACLEVGPDVVVSGDVLSEIDVAVEQAYIEARLRKSIVKDALFDRENTDNNTPVFKELKFVEKPGARLHLMLKGGGSDNASRVVMLSPGDGKERIVEEVLTAVAQKAANACPPLVVGIGVGATFDKVANLAKYALMRPLDCKSTRPEINDFEAELLHLINETGIGAGALGGDTTALGVRVQTAPCHIAALPLAINMGCSAMRRGTYEL